MFNLPQEILNLKHRVEKVEEENKQLKKKVRNLEMKLEQLWAEKVAKRF
jgi:hypothetical protein